MNRSLTHIVICLLLFLACTEPFDFEYDEVDKGKVVIDGYLTDELMIHRIRVSESTRLGDFNGIEARYIEDATVNLIDDQGVMMSFSHRESGEYYSDQPIQAEIGRSYSLNVTLKDGRVFTSDAESLQTEQMEPMDIRYEVGEREVLLNGRIFSQEALILSNQVTKSNGDRYYQWVIEEYFIKESDAAPVRTIEEEANLPDTAALRFCYVKDFAEPDLYIKQDIYNTAIEGDQYNQFLKYIALDSRWEFEFVIVVRQLMLDRDSFLFWEEINALSNNSGGLFDPTPYSISGNVTQQNGNAQALGYFGVYKTELSRVFLTLSDLNLVETYPPCLLTPSPRPQPCANCRLWLYDENFANNKPDWWR